MSLWLAAVLIAVLLLCIAGDLWLLHEMWKDRRR